jgi:hypothetical protein
LAWKRFGLHVTIFKLIYLDYLARNNIPKFLYKNPIQKVTKVVEKKQKKIEKS